MTEIKSADAATSNPHALRLVELRHAETSKRIWLNVANIKVIRERTVDPDIAAQIPDEAEVAETYITQKGEPLGIVVQGRPSDVLIKIRDKSVYL